MCSVGSSACWRVMRRQPLLLRRSLKFSSPLRHRRPAQHRQGLAVGRAMVEDGVTDGEIILAIAIRPIPVHAAIATIAIGVVKDATGTKVLVLKVGMTAVVAMTAVMEVVHVGTARAVAAVRDDRTRTVAVSRVNEKVAAPIETLHAGSQVVSTAMALVATKGRVASLAASIATRAAGIPQALPAAPTKGNAATRAARAAPSKAAASTRMRATIVGATLTAVTQRRRTRASHRTISGTGSKAPKRTAMGPTVSARSVAANVAVVADADADGAAVVAVARVEIARADHLRVDRRKAAGQRTRLPRKLHRYRRLTAATNMVGAKANTTVVVRVAPGASNRPSVM